MQRILIVAGEPSGDMHGAKLADAILKQSPQTEITGMGGACMRQAGVNTLVSIENLSVVGVFEAIAKIPAHYQAKKVLERYLDEAKPNSVVLIDYPGFNLNLAESIKRRGIRLVYYISPQLWAWAQGRIRKMKRLVDLMLVILPFEEDLYRQAGVPVEFVGHPLLDQIPADLQGRGAIQPNLIGLLPGSREGEVRRILPIMRDTAEMIRMKYPDAEFFLPLSPNVQMSLVEKILGSLKVRIVPSPAYVLRRRAAFALTASGTATLENALLGLPMAVIYSLMPLTYLIGRMLVRIDKIGLVNIVAEEKIVPEYIQYAARPLDISEYVIRFLSDESLQKSVARGLDRVRESLGIPGASDRAAALVLQGTL